MLFKTSLGKKVHFHSKSLPLAKFRTSLGFALTQKIKQIQDSKEMAPIICKVCTGQKIGHLEEFPSTEAVIFHVTYYHCVFHPCQIQEFVDADLTYIGDVLSKILGKNNFEWIKSPNKSPYSHCCEISFPSWDDAIAHTITQHKVGDDYYICQLLGKDLLASIPEIRKRLYTCIYCPRPKVFQFDTSLKQHFILYHRKSEIDASTLTNIQRNLSIFDEVMKEVIEETN